MSMMSEKQAIDLVQPVEHFLPPKEYDKLVQSISSALDSVFIIGFIIGIILAAIFVHFVL